MQLNFYDTRIGEDYQTSLVKEKTVFYEAEKISKPKEFAELMQKVLFMNKLAEEYCYMIALNNRNRVLGVFFISKGTVSHSLIGSREVFMRALVIGAAHIILCHNHPSGDCFPSKDDILLTKRFKEAGELLGIPLSDHIIVGEDKYFSFYENELF